MGIWYFFKIREDVLGFLEFGSILVVIFVSYERYFMIEDKKFLYIINFKIGFFVKDDIVSIIVVDINLIFVDVMLIVFFVMGFKKAINFI